MIRPIAIVAATLAATAIAAADSRVSFFPATPSSRPHDVAVTADGIEAWGAESGNDRLVQIKF